MDNCAVCGGGKGDLMCKAVKRGGAIPYGCSGQLSREVTLSRGQKEVREGLWEFGTSDSKPRKQQVQRS